MSAVQPVGLLSHHDSSFLSVTVRVRVMLTKVRDSTVTPFTHYSDLCFSWLPSVFSEKCWVRTTIGSVANGCSFEIHYHHSGAPSHLIRRCKISAFEFLSLNKVISNINIIISDKYFENVTKFKFLWMTITNTNEVHDDIRRRIDFASVCYQIWDLFSVYLF
jgi:hypothetical protein